LIALEKFMYQVHLLLLIAANSQKPQTVEEAQKLKEFEVPVLLKEQTGTMDHNVRRFRRSFYNAYNCHKRSIVLFPSLPGDEGSLESSRAFFRARHPSRAGSRK